MVRDKDNIKFTIITVSYNAVSTIEDTILSIINQKYNNIEYIIIDGGSTDGTIDIIKKYEDRISYWVTEPDEGIYDAMNKGLKYATGDYVFFLGADDLLYNSCTLSDLYPHLTDSNTVYYSNTLLVPSGRIYGEKMNKRKMCLKNINHQAIFYPKNIFKKYKYEIQYKIYADYYLNLMCFSDKDFRFKYINTIVSLFNEQGFSSNKKDIEFDKDFFPLIKSRFGYVYFLYSKSVLYLYRLKNNG